MRIGIGVMGCANIARRHVIPAIQQTEEFELKAVASRDKQKAREFGDLFGCDALCGYEALLQREDIGAVYMPLPTGIHEPWMMETITAGKHILAEKSLAVDYASATRIMAAAKDAGLVVMENLMFEYHSQQDRVRQIVNSGELGQIRLFRSSFGFPPLDPANFRYDKDLGGGALLDCGAYPLKATQVLWGPDVRVHHAMLHYDDTRDVDLYGSAFLSVAADGRTIPAEVSFGMDNYYQCCYDIWGSKGRLVAARAFTAPPGFRPGMRIEKQDECHEYALPQDNHFVGTLRHFAAAIRDGRAADEAAKVLRQAKLLEDVRTHATRI